MSIQKLSIVFKEPWRLIASDRLGDLARSVPDELFLKCRYRTLVGEWPNLKDPVGYMEKLQWLKLHDRRAIYTQMVDKALAKEFVRQRIGDQYLIPTLGIYESFDQIPLEELPNQFVIKCTHDSAGLVICRDKMSFDPDAARKKIETCLKRNFYYTGREWPYKNVKPRIIVEKYMEDPVDGELRDYKFFTFGGVPKVLYITSGRGSGEASADFFDMEFNHLDLCIDHETAPTPPRKPENFEKMQELATILSAGTPQLRVDFYEVEGRIYFGEMTFFHCSGFAKFRPNHWNQLWGSWVKLPEPNA